MILSFNEVLKIKDTQIVQFLITDNALYESIIFISRFKNSLFMCEAALTLSDDAEAKKKSFTENFTFLIN